MRRWCWPTELPGSSGLAHRRQAAAGACGGSDLAPALFAAAADENPLSVYLLGAAPAWPSGQPSTSSSAGRRCGSSAPTAHHWASKRSGRERADHGQDRRGQTALATAGTRRSEARTVGASAPTRITGRCRFVRRCDDRFSGGRSPLRPVWMRKCGLEWLHRVAQEPKRPVRRYAHDARVFPAIDLARVAFEGAAGGPAQDQAKAV